MHHDGFSYADAHLLWQRQVCVAQAWGPEYVGVSVEMKWNEVLSALFRPMQATACRRSISAIDAGFQHDCGASARATFNTANIISSACTFYLLSPSDPEEAFVTAKVLCAGG